MIWSNGDSWLIDCHTWWFKFVPFQVLSTFRLMSPTIQNDVNNCLPLTIFQDFKLFRVLGSFLVFLTFQSTKKTNSRGSKPFDWRNCRQSHKLKSTKAIFQQIWIISSTQSFNNRSVFAYIHNSSWLTHFSCSQPFHYCRLYCRQSAKLVE